MIYRATEKDIAELAALAVQLWDGHDEDELCAELAEYIKNGAAQFFIARENGIAIGFAQCQLRRDYVEGTSTSPVGYLEGIFVSEEYRDRGIARQLLCECEKWAKEAGCSEFASDCELTNSTSLAFHLAVGFEEANRIICFTKKL